MTQRAVVENTTVILADPPWPHANGSVTNSGKSPKYPLMSLVDVESLAGTVQHLAGSDAVLYLWTTTPHLPGALQVIDSWGFTYRSLHVWRKTRIACGFWARSNAELCLIAERGRPASPTPSLLMKTIIEGAPASSRHSSKPDSIPRTIEDHWPAARKIELFARDTRDGWESYGIDVGYKITATGIEKI